jgi:hypothetical protein
VHTIREEELHVEANSKIRYVSAIPALSVTNCYQRQRCLSIKDKFLAEQYCVNLGFILDLKLRLNNETFSLDLPKYRACFVRLIFH